MNDHRNGKPAAKDHSAPAVLTRRRILQGAGGVFAAAAFPAERLTSATQPPRQQSPVPKPPSAPGADLTGQLARYMADARNRDLPPKVALEAKHHILDTLGAIVSGTHLKAGEMAIAYVRAQGGTPEASVIGANFKTSAVNAAFANAMSAHGDETDDVELATHAHPGSSSVPAALAMAEREGRSGAEFLRAVTLGYDICCRFLTALDTENVRGTHRSSEGLGSTLAAAAAAASLARLDEMQMRYVLSYAAQQASGLWSWTQDTEHVEKAFDFAGMGARNGVGAATMVQAGFTGVRDILECEHNVLEALSSQPRPQEMVAGLGSRFWIAETSIKTFSFGYPIQSALDAFFTLRKQYSLRVDNMDRIVVRLPPDGAGIVDNSSMPDVNLQYAIAVALVDGAVSFADSHSYERMKDPQILAVKSRVQLLADPKLADLATPRSAIVEVTLKDGRIVNHFTRFPPGTKENPLDTEGVNAKVRDLMAPILGAERTATFIRRVNALEDVRDVRELRPLFTL
ncbi:MAG: MmgE/PrpD family protein [Acidobacteriia bacterium]|nr:MmgE/PrpD family protein [Terriglobia bacterium]